jgi:hypothetical protein
VQKGVDSMHSLFLRHVAVSREGMTTPKLASVADAGVYIGLEAVKVGLVDNVEGMEQAHKRSVRLNTEGKKKQMNGNAELHAMLNPDTVPPAVPPMPTTNANTVQPTTISNSDAQLLLAVKNSGITTVDELHKFAAKAKAGGEALDAKKAEAKALAVSAFGQGSAALVGATVMIEAADSYTLLAGMCDMYTEGIKLRGLGGGTEPQPRVSAPSYNGGGGPSAPVAGLGDHNAPPPSQAVSTVGQGAGEQINGAVDSYLGRRNSSIVKQINK